MAERKKQKVKGCKKCGRNQRKKERRGTAISSFVRNLISAVEYFKQSNQKVKKHD